MLLIGVAAKLIDGVWLEPRAPGLACLHHTGGAIMCATIAASRWLAHFQVWGTAALLLGIWSIAGAPFAVVLAATCIGIIGAIDYNVSWSVLGLALGAWAWLSRPRA